TDVIACDFGKPAGSDIVALRGSDGTVGSIVWSVEDDSNPTMCVPWYADAEAFAVQGNNSSNAVQVGQSAQCGTVGVWRDEKGVVVWQITGSSVLASSSA